MRRVFIRLCGVMCWLALITAAAVGGLVLLVAQADARDPAWPHAVAGSVMPGEYPAWAFDIEVQDNENRAPVAEDDIYSTAEDEVLSVITASGVLTNDVDPDNDPLTATLLTGPLSGTLTLELDGSFIYTPTANFHGQDVFTYVASDGALTDTATVTITINPVNDPPVAEDDTYSTDEDMVLSVEASGVLGNDNDLDNDPLTATLLTGPLSGTLTLELDGSFIYTPTANFHGQDVFTYVASDGALTDTATVTITVNPVNDAPVLSPIGNQTVAEGSLLTFTATASDADIPANTLTFSLQDGEEGEVPEGAEIDPDTGAFSWTPTEAQGPDEYTFDVCVSDGALQDCETITVTVNEVDLTIAKEPDLQYVRSGGTASFTITVRNTGDSPLTGVTVSDPLAPNCNRTLDNLASGAYTTYICSRAGVTADFTNVATVNATAPGGATVSASDSAQVDVIAPALTIAKVPDLQYVRSGGTATFTITVRNTGDSTLSGVTVSDSLAPNCNRALDGLASGGSFVYTCVANNVTNSFTNVITVTAAPLAGGRLITSDTARVEVPFVYLPVILKPATILYVTTENTGGVSLLRIMKPGSNALVHSCANIPDNTVGHLCGAFPPGTYQVEAQTRRCGILRAEKTWPAGPVTIRIWCE